MTTTCDRQGEVFVVLFFYFSWSVVCFMVFDLSQNTNALSELKYVSYNQNNNNKLSNKQNITS